MRRKLTATLIAAVLVLAGGAAGAVTADNLWGTATEKPPCVEWRNRVFTNDGTILAITADPNTGWSSSAARGLLDEPACKWVFHEKGDAGKSTKNVYWNRKYELAVYYDMLIAQHAAERNRHTDYRTLRDVINRDDYRTFDARCEEVDGGEVIQDNYGLEYCNFGSLDFDWDEDDYIIRGPR